MPFIQLLLLGGVGLVSFAILFQDFKHRLVSLWILIAFGVICVASVLYTGGIKILLVNVLSTVVYLGVLWLMIKLYLFLKFKKNKVIINELLGSADVLVILFIGLTFNLIGLIYFFCFAFIFSLVGHLMSLSLNKTSIHKTIPLAGFMVIFYIVSIIILYLVNVTDYVECSFVNYE